MKHFIAALKKGLSKVKVELPDGSIASSALCDYHFVSVSPVPGHNNTLRLVGCLMAPQTAQIINTLQKLEYWRMNYNIGIRVKGSAVYVTHAHADGSSKEWKSLLEHVRGTND